MRCSGRLNCLIVLAFLALSGCMAWPPGDIRALSQNVEKVSQSLAITQETLERMEVAGNDPNKYDAVQETLATARAVTDGLKAAVADVNSPPVDGKALEATGKAVAAAVTVATPVGGAIIYGLSSLLGTWFRRDQDVIPTGRNSI